MRVFQNPARCLCIKLYSLIWTEPCWTPLKIWPPQANTSAGKWLAVYSVEEFRAMVGHGIRNLVTQFSPEAYRDEAHVDGTLAQFSAYYGAHSMDHTRPYSGIPALLSRLRDAGICLAVCSNKADDFSRQLIEHYFPGRFSLVRGKLGRSSGQAGPCRCLRHPRSVAC